MQIKFGKLEHVRMSLFNKENHYISLRKDMAIMEQRGNGCCKKKFQGVPY